MSFLRKIFQPTLPQSPASAALNRALWKFGWVPVPFILVKISRERHYGIQLYNYRDLNLVRDYDMIRKSYPLTYKSKWRDYVLKLEASEDTKFMRKYKKKSVIEDHYTRDILQGNYNDKNYVPPKHGMGWGGNGR